VDGAAVEGADVVGSAVGVEGITVGSVVGADGSTVGSAVGAEVGSIEGSGVGGWA